MKEKKVQMFYTFNRFFSITCVFFCTSLHLNIHIINSSSLLIPETGKKSILNMEPDSLMIAAKHTEYEICSDAFQTLRDVSELQS